MNNTIKAIIIDDEPPARELIKALVAKWPEIVVIDECSNGFDALKSIRDNKPELLFLDIQMPKVTGLELLEVVDEPVHVIFTTAYDQFAIKAFELNAADYLLKPFSEKRFGEAVQKVISKIASGINNTPTLIDAIQDQAPEMLDRIAVKLGSKLQVIGLDKILYFEAQDDYVLIHSEGARFLKSKTMAYFENHLPGDRFVRIHRSFLINTEKIARLEPYDKDTYLAIMSNDDKLKVSRTGYKRLRELLKF